MPRLRLPVSPQRRKIAASPVWHRLIAPSHTLPHTMPVRILDSKLIADDGDATPHPIQARRRSVSSAFPCIASRDSRDCGRGGFRRTFQRGRPRSQLPTESVLPQSSAKVFPELVADAGCAAQQATAHRQARLNSRNLLIIATHLHIVNHSSTHRRKSRFQNLKVQGFKVLSCLKVCTADPLSLKLCNLATLKPDR